jgi:hypothetical protein
MSDEDIDLILSDSFALYTTDGLKVETLTIRLTVEQKDTLVKMAQAKGMTVTSFIMGLLDKAYKDDYIIGLLERFMFD